MMILANGSCHNEGTISISISFKDFFFFSIPKKIIFQSGTGWL